MGCKEGDEELFFFIGCVELVNDVVEFCCCDADVVGASDLVDDFGRCRSKKILYVRV